MTIYIVWGWYTTAIGDLSKEIVDIYASRDHSIKRLAQAKDHARMLSTGANFTIEEREVKMESPY